MFEGGAEGVGIGGNIAPGIYLRYAHDIATNDDRVGVEWQLPPALDAAQRGQAATATPAST